MIERQPFSKPSQPPAPAARPKRQSKPSPFTASIQTFKAQEDKTARNATTFSPPSKETHFESLSSSRTLNSQFKCILPAGRKLSLFIVIRKRHQRKGRKNPLVRKESFKEQESGLAEGKEGSSAGVGLLDKFLMAAEELNKIEQGGRDKLSSENLLASQCRQSQTEKKELRGRSERNQAQKLSRFCQKQRILSQRIQNLLTDMVYL